MYFNNYIHEIKQIYVKSLHMSIILEDEYSNSYVNVIL